MYVIMRVISVCISKLNSPIQLMCYYVHASGGYIWPGIAYANSGNFSFILSKYPKKNINIQINGGVFFLDTVLNSKRDFIENKLNLVNLINLHYKTEKSQKIVSSNMDLNFQDMIFINSTEENNEIFNIKYK